MCEMSGQAGNFLLEGLYQATTPGVQPPSLYKQCVGSLTSHNVYNTKELRDGTYSLQSKKT